MATPSNKPSYSIARRLAIGAAIWCSIALAGTGLVLVGLFQSHIERQFDAQLRNYLLYVVSQVAVLEPGDPISLSSPPSSPAFNKPFSGWTWQVRRQDVVLAQSRSLGPVTGGDEVIAPPIGASGAFTAPGGLASRGLAREITPRDGGAVLIVAVSGPASDIEAALDTFRGAVMASFAVLGVVLLGTILFLMRTSLRPLEALRARVLAIRKGSQLEDRGWPRELAPVVDELDALTAHNDQLIQRARGAAADLAHAVKTPLAVLGQIAPRLPQEDAGAVREQVDRINAFLSRHLGRSRAWGSLRGDVAVGPIVNDLVRTLQIDFDRRGLRAVQTIPPGLRFAGDETDLFEMLGNLVDNAGKWADGRVVISGAAEGAHIRLVIEDDGPGIPADQREAILQRGSRLDESLPGQGLGLSIARDIAQLYGGSLSIGTSDLQGAAITLILPRAEAT